MDLGEDVVQPGSLHLGGHAPADMLLIFLKAGWFPLVVTRDDRAKYIESLEKADQGGLAPLVSLFTEIQKRSLLKALQVVSEVHPPTTIDEAVSAARAHLMAKGRVAPREWDQVKDTARYLLNTAGMKLNEVAAMLEAEIGSGRAAYKFSVATGGQAGFPAPLDVASQLNYTASPKEFHEWVTLTLKAEGSLELVVSFHGLGAQFRGLLAASAFVQPEQGAPVAVSDDFFQLNYKEARADAAKRFRPWLESAIVRGLTLWRQRL